MNSIWDKVRDGIDRANKAAQDVIDEGKLRVDAYRAREAADKAAEAVGYGVFRASEAGLELEPATWERLFAALRDRDAEAKRLEAAIEAVKAGAAPADATGASTTPSAAPSTGPATDVPPADIPFAGPPGDPSPTGPGDPPTTPYASTAPDATASHPRTTPPPGVDPTATSGQGGS